jgi:hypothetical protein
VQEALSAQDVLSVLPGELVELLADVSGKSDNIITTVLESFDDETGLRGLFVNTGMAENRGSWVFINLRLRPFGREVVQECKRFVDEHRSDDIPSALARLARRRDHIALEGVPAYH